MSKVNGTTTVPAFAAGTGATLIFTPDDIGTYTVTLTAKDKNGQIGSTTQIITGTAVQPTATIVGPTTGAEGAAVTLTGSASDAGSADTSAGFTFVWNVTEAHRGTTTSYASATYAAGATSSTFSFTPNDFGTYTVTLVATDHDGVSSPLASQTITVPGVPPAPTISPSTTTSDPEGTAVTLTGTATDQSTVDTSAGFTFTWNVSKVNGTTTVASFATGTGSTLVFTPDDIGTYTVTMTAKDKTARPAAPRKLSRRPRCSPRPPLHLRPSPPMGPAWP